MDTALLTPFMPNGFSPVLAAAVPAFFSYAGFMVIIEIGGEIRDPGRNIPLALLFSFLTVLVVYTLVSLVVVGVIPWTELGETGAPVGEAAARILPGWLATAVTLTATAAAASSVNVLLLAYSRDVLALAKARVFPPVLAMVSEKYGEPRNAVVFMTLFGLLAVFMGGRIAPYATLTAIGLLILQINVGIAMFRIPKELPELFNSAGFKLGPVALPFFAGGLVLLSVVFLGIAVWDDAGIVLTAAGFTALGALYYLFRRRHLRALGVDVDALVREEVEGLRSDVA
jgi:APA family basic amino acid/polyamine antiporter